MYHLVVATLAAMNCTLTERFGAEIIHPTATQIAEALHAVADPTQHDPEHPNTWLDVVLGDVGPLISLDYYDSGLLIFSQYTDVDMGDELAPEESLPQIDVTDAITLFEQLSRGELETVQRFFASRRDS